MPSHPPHFELVENGFLLTVETPSILLTDRKSALDFQYSVRKHFTNHLVVDGYIDRDCAIACDGSDGQIWFEYSPDVVLQREIIAQQVFDALSFWNSLKVMTFLSPSLVRIGYAPNPIFDLQPLGLTKGGKV